jgi:hypothetical protein
LQLAASDLLFLLIISFNVIKHKLAEGSLFSNPMIDCLLCDLCFIFEVVGIGMMLMISVLRYRATVHPLKPAISRRKLKLVCGLVYVAGFVLGYGPAMPECLMNSSDALTAFYLFRAGYMISCYYTFPTIFMAVVYYKISRELTKQNDHMRSVCANPVRPSPPSSSISILKHIRNRRTFFVCIVTVLCYAIGNIPFAVRLIFKYRFEYDLVLGDAWIGEYALVVRVAGTCSVNPLIYGILDKRLLAFWKICSCRSKETPQVN